MTLLHDLFFSQPSPSEGYRVNEDSFHLSSFIPLKYRSMPILDIGAGSGLISVLLASRGFTDIFSIEIQKLFSVHFQCNIVENKHNASILAISGDANLESCPFKPLSFHNIVSNPPYYKIGSGRLPKSKLSAISKHEFKLSCSSFRDAANYLLISSGNCFLSVANIRIAEYLLRFQEDFSLIERVDISRKSSLLWFRKN